MTDLGNLGMTEECQYNKNEVNTYYMSHRPIIREDKCVMKIGIVFDSLSKGKDERYLNECLNVYFQGSI